MSNKYTESESPVVSLQNEFARQRWELFHRAIAHAKQSNDASAAENERSSTEPNPAPILSVVR